jgi:uncharacterized membrane protein
VERPRTRGIRRRLVRYFLQGVLYLAPLGIIVYLVWKVFSILDGHTVKTVEALWGIRLPGLGILLLVLFLTALGWVGSSIIARPIRRLVGDVLRRAPVLKTIHGSLSDILGVLLNQDRKFKQPVLVLMDEATRLEKLGFITQEELGPLGLEGRVAVYFPHSYNFSGELYLVPRERVTPVEMSAQEAMRLIVSGGVIRVRGEGRG